MNHSKIVERIKEYGCCKVDNFLDEKNLELIDKILKNRVLEKKIGKNDLDTYFYRDRDKNFLLKKIIKLNFSFFFDCLKLIKLSKQLKLNILADKILSSKSKLHTIDSYFSPKSDKPVLDWHLDQAYSGKVNVNNYLNPDHAALKFFIYLTPVSYENGCLGYIPGSNKIAYYLKKGIFEGELAYKPYWTLRDFRNLVQEKNYHTYIQKYVDSNELELFFDNTAFVENGYKQNKDFFNKLDRGGAIIFDESGAHIGSKPSKNDRLVLRYSYKVENYKE